VRPGGEGTLTVDADLELELEPHPTPSTTPPATSPSWFSRALHFWRSPAGQPRWARPALLVVTAVAGFAYAWSMNGAYLEPFYGGAARSMATSWHDFVFGAADPWGTVSVDKLPGALWIQALSIRLFGFHVWAVVLPQVVEGMLTVLVLYRVVRRVAGAGAGIVAAIVMACSPVVILLDRGNISDSLLLLLLVLAADATVRATQHGSLRSLLWAGVLVGFAFQAKMLQAWLVLPAFYLAYLVAAPAVSWLRRVGHLALGALATAVVSLSWMSAVSLVPQSSRPYVDGSCNDSLFSQVFGYNGFDRLGGATLNTAGCTRPSTFLYTLQDYSTAHGYGTFAIAASWDRLLRGPFGHDDAWLLLPALVAAVWLLVLQRRQPRTDLLRAAVLLWFGWLVLTFGFFSASWFLNSYYTAALIPAVAALCGMGAAAAWHRRQSHAVRGALIALVVATVAITVALVPGYVGVRWWILTTTVVAGALAVWFLATSLRPDHDTTVRVTAAFALSGAAVLLGSAWASAAVVNATLSPFDSPYAPTSVNNYSQVAAARFPDEMLSLNEFVANLPADVAADVFETSAGAGYDIMATGHEFLPVGGFTGSVPAPSLAEFKRFVAEGRVNRVTATTRPLTRNPDLRWVVSHCTLQEPLPFDPASQSIRSVYYCHAPKPRHGTAPAGQPVSGP